MRTKPKKSSNLTLVGAALVLLVFLQLVLSFMLWRDNRQLNEEFAVFADYYAHTESDLFEVRPIADPASKRLYLPGLNLYLPLTPESLNLSYRVTDAHGGGTADLVFMSTINNRVSGPQADACRDLVRVEVGTGSSAARGGETAKKPFSLADGRMVYVYLPENSSDCQDGLVVTPQEVEAAIRQLRSY